MVGGSTRIPKIQSLLSQFFNGKELNGSINPDEAVAWGAAVQAAVLTNAMDSSKAPVLVDVAPLSLGIETAGGIMTKLIERNKSIRIEQQKGRLSTEEIERIVQEAEKYKQEDIARRAKVDARNQLENVVYQTKNQLGEKISSVNEYCDEVIQWLESNDEASTEELQAKMKEFQDRVQQEVQANGGAMGGDGQGQEAQADADI